MEKSVQTSHSGQNSGWQLQYEDTFDREAPPALDAAGGDIIDGLRELWARHLFESVRPDGERGFARFSLFWAEKEKTVAVSGEWRGQ